MVLRFTDSKRAELQASIDAACKAFTLDAAYMVEMIEAGATIIRRKRERLEASQST